MSRHNPSAYFNGGKFMEKKQYRQNGEKGCCRTWEYCAEEQGLKNLKDNAKEKLDGTYSEEKMDYSLIIL